MVYGREWEMPFSCCLLGSIITYVFLNSVNPKLGKLSNPHASPIPLKNHLKQLHTKLMLKYFPRQRTCFLWKQNYTNTITSNYYEILYITTCIRYFLKNNTNFGKGQGDKTLRINNVSSGKELLLNTTGSWIPVKGNIK